MCEMWLLVLEVVGYDVVVVGVEDVSVASVRDIVVVSGEVGGVGLGVVDWKNMFWMFLTCSWPISLVVGLLRRLGGVFKFWRR